MADLIDLNDRLRHHSDLLLRDSLEYAKLARAAVDARNDYDLSKAKQTLLVSTEIKGVKVAERAAEVLLRVEGEMRAARIAEAHLDAMAKRLRAVEASLSAVQSQARMLKLDGEY